MSALVAWVMLSVMAVVELDRVLLSRQLRRCVETMDRMERQAEELRAEVSRWRTEASGQAVEAEHYRDLWSKARK